MTPETITDEEIEVERLLSDPAGDDGDPGDADDDGDDGSDDGGADDDS
jgi:hypothetical protein